MPIDQENAKVPMKPRVPDFCPACDIADQPFTPVLRVVAQEYRGGIFEVKAPAMRCVHCGFEIAAPGDLNALCVETKKAYDKDVLFHARDQKPL